MLGLENEICSITHPPHPLHSPCTPPSHPLHTHSHTSTHIFTPRRQGLDRKKLARLAVESYLQQILRHGFFHADPHPGNVAVDAKGKLIYYDFGMCGTIPCE